MRGKQQVVTTESISLNKEATVFQAEAVEIEKAAKFLNLKTQSHVTNI